MSEEKGCVKCAVTLKSRKEHFRRLDQVYRKCSTFNIIILKQLHVQIVVILSFIKKVQTVQVTL